MNKAKHIREVVLGCYRTFNKGVTGRLTLKWMNEWCVYKKQIFCVKSYNFSSVGFYLILLRMYHDASNIRSGWAFIALFQLFKGVCM